MYIIQGVLDENSILKVRESLFCFYSLRKGSFLFFIVEVAFKTGADNLEMLSNQSGIVHRQNIAQLGRNWKHYLKR